MKPKTWLAVLGALSVIAVAALAAGCGDDEDDNGSRNVGNATDAAFVNDMVPHHEAAVEMAEIAKERARHSELRDLADDIIAAQKREIKTMKSVEGDLGHVGGHMGGDEHMRGMDVDMHMLREGKQFDSAFIDMMIPHHEGAVRMAKEELAEGENATLRGLAEDIVAAQEHEIAQMREWREAWYGSAGSMMHESEDSMSAG